jgi:FkbM family methyltransferase
MFMMLEYLESSAEHPVLSGLRWLLATGETLPPDLCRRWLALYTRVPLLNAYGPTECSDDVTHYPIYTPLDSGARLVPIGRPIANMRTYVMKWSRGAYSLCAPSNKGELFVAGHGVGRGYLNDPEATRKSFFRDPFRTECDARIYRTGDLVRIRADGVLEFLGRVDRQLKVRGHRIEPEEIEAALREHPCVKDAVVSICGVESRLVAFVQPRWRNCPTVTGYPRHKLPNGMAIARLTRSEVDFLYADIFERNAYTKHGLSIHPGACVVDVGANIGLFSLFAHEQSQGGAIYAFEPVPELFQFLRVNLRLYDVNAQLYQYGLARSPGTTTITYYPGFSTLSGLYPDLTQDKDVALSYIRHRREREPELAAESNIEDALIEGLLEDRFQAQTQRIALTTLSDFIVENEIEQIDFLKVNVEGAELDVLHGIKPHHWPRIAQIALEIHDVNGRLRDVQGILRRQGFDVAVEQDWSLEQTMKTNFYVYARRAHAARATRGRAQFQRTRTDSQQARILSPDELKNLLRKRLPDYMVPLEYRFTERFPLTPTGKVDRRKLMQTGTTLNRGDRSTPARPRTEVERTLLGIWKEVLGLDRIGIHDNFFDRGGHSLLGAKMLVRVRTTIGSELPLKSVFEHPTVARLARAIEEYKPTTV